MKSPHHHPDTAGCNASFGLAQSGSAQGWPIVLYFHHVSPDIDHYTALTPYLFRQALELCLEFLGPAHSPDTIETLLTQHQANRKPGFVVTFDDGYRDVVDHALPILQDLDIPALHFLIAEAVDTGACAGIKTPRASFLRHEDIATLSAAGHRFGAHSRRHVPPNNLSDYDLCMEIERGFCEEAQPGPGEKPLFALPYGITPAKSLPARLNEVLYFGTVRADAVDWRHCCAAAPIRRTFLPSDAPETWENLVRGWAAQSMLGHAP